MKRAIVTGATGMLGRTLIEYLLTKDYQILAIMRENSECKNLFEKTHNLQIIQCDLKNYYCLNNTENQKYDEFFHFAWNGSNVEDRNKDEVQRLNIPYTNEAVKLANRFGCRIFLGAGSQAEYGLKNEVIHENLKCEPVTAYGRYKLEAGIQSRILANELGIEHIWPRIFSSFGPYGKDNTMIMQSISSFEKNQSPEYTKAEQQWDYIYSKDVAKAYYLLAQKGKNHEVYNIAQGHSRKLQEYIESIRDIMNSNVELKFGMIPYSENQVMNLLVSINKIKEDTGFVPEYTFEEGIIETINWYRGKNYEKS